MRKLSLVLSLILVLGAVAPLQAATFGKKKSTDVMTRDGVRDRDSFERRIQRLIGRLLGGPVAQEQPVMPNPAPTTNS